MEFIVKNIPYWVVDLLPLFVFILLCLIIFKIRSKTVVILLITLSAMIVFYLSNFISTACWADLKCSVASQENICYVNSYCVVAEESKLTTFLAFLKAFVLWFVALTIIFTKSIFIRDN